MESKVTEVEEAASTLAGRVARLERANRRLKQAGLAAIVIVSGLSSLGLGGDPKVETKVETKALHLVDEEGRVRVLLSVRAGLSLLDEAGRPRAVLSLTGESPGLSLSGGSSQAGLSLEVGDDGPALAMRDAAGRTRVLLAAVPQGPGLVLWDDRAAEGAALVSRRIGGSLTLMGQPGDPPWRAP